MKHLQNALCWFFPFWFILCNSYKDIRAKGAIIRSCANFPKILQTPFSAHDLFCCVLHSIFAFSCIHWSGFTPVARILLVTLILRAWVFTPSRTGFISVSNTSLVSRKVFNLFGKFYFVAPIVSLSLSSFFFFFFPFRLKAVFITVTKNPLC